MATIVRALWWLLSWICKLPAVSCLISPAFNSVVTVDTHIMVNWQQSKQLPADQCHMTVSRAQVYNIKLSADQLMVFTCSRAQVQNFSCVVPENIKKPPPPRRATEILRGGPRGGNFKGGGGGFLRSFFLGLQVRLEGYLKNNSCSVEQALSYHFYC